MSRVTGKIYVGIYMAYRHTSTVRKPNKLIFCLQSAYFIGSTFAPPKKIK